MLLILHSLGNEAADTTYKFSSGHLKVRGLKSLFQTAVRKSSSFYYGKNHIVIQKLVNEESDSQMGFFQTFGLRIWSRNDSDGGKECPYWLF